jgi:hypothetical protein
MLHNFSDAPASTFQCRTRHLLLPKHGHWDSEFEDALAENSAEGRFAVADGATEAICSDIWARLLASALVKQPLPDAAEWERWLAEQRGTWLEAVRGLPLDLFAEMKLAEGAAAAVLALQIEPHGGWTALSVGDSCLFQVRGEDLVGAFPKTSSKQFDNRPPLVRTAAVNQALPTVARGDWQSGDKLVLMTDALSQWFLQEYEQNRPLRTTLEDLLAVAADRAALEQKINRLRDSAMLRNDDIVLVAVDVWGDERLCP